MSSIIRCRTGVMESSFTKWNLLQAALPCFRKGAQVGNGEVGSPDSRLRRIPRSGLVQGRISRAAFTEVSVAILDAPSGSRATRTKLGFGRRGPQVAIWEA